MQESFIMLLSGFLILISCFQLPATVNANAKLEAAANVAGIAAEAAKAGEQIAKKYHDEVKNAPKSLMDATKIEKKAAEIMLSNEKAGTREISIATNQGFGSLGNFQPPGFKIKQINYGSSSEKRVEPSEQSSANRAFSYPMGIGPLLFGGCTGDQYSKTSPCFNSKQYFLQKGQCNEQLDAGNFIGVGFDGRGYYSAESRKTSLVQRKCAAGSYFLNSQVPDVMNCYGIYDTNVESKTFESTEDYMSFIREKAGVSNTKSMFKAEAQKMSQSSGWGFDLGAIGSVVGGLIGGKKGGAEGAQKGAQMGAALGGMLSFGSGQGSGSASDKQNADSKANGQQSDSSNRNSASSQNIFAIMNVNIVLFEIALDEVTPSDVSFAFFKDYASLPDTYLSAGSQAKYQDFLLRWGTHFIRSAKMGGQLRITKTSKKEKSTSATEFAKIAENEFSAMFSNLESSWSQKSSGFTFLGFGSKQQSSTQKEHATKKTDQGSTMSAQNKLTEAMKQSQFTQTQVSAQGGDPQIAQAVVDFYTPSFKDTFNAWLKSIFDYPKPIEFTLKSIDELLNFNVNALFPGGDDIDFGCSGKMKGVTLHTDAVTKKRFFYTDEVKKIGNETKTVKSIVHCEYNSVEEFKESFRKKHIALQKAIEVYMVEGPFPTSSFDIPGGKPGCETDTIASLRGSNVNPTWASMKSGKFRVLFDMPRDIPAVAGKNQEFTMSYLFQKWFATKPNQEILHLYEGCSVIPDIKNPNRICINNLIMSYDEINGFLTVKEEDYKQSVIYNPFLPVWLSGTTIAKAQAISVLDLAKTKKMEGKAFAIPCSVQWRNALRIDPSVKDTCIHFSAASAGDIFVIFSAIPKEKNSWYYLHITSQGVAYYKGMMLEKTDYGTGLGTLGDANLFESYFVCFLHYDNGQHGIQYGKADPDSEVGQVHSAFTFAGSGEEVPISYYTFGSGSSPISFHDVRITKKLPLLKCPNDGYKIVNGRCEIACDEECMGCKKPESSKDCFKCKNVRIMNINADTPLTCFASCPPGWTSSESDNTVCTKCAIGTYKDSNGNQACTPCKTGTYANVLGSKICTECQEGYFCSKTGCDRCHKCPVGKFTSVKGSINCALCPVSTANSALGATKCEKCEPGHYSDVAGLSECKKCNAGTYAFKSGSKTCLNCPSGSSSAIGSSSCNNNCVAGTYSPSKGTPCAPCPAGKVAPGAGSLSCTQCKKGTYQPTTKGTSCIIAPVGHYVDTVEATSAKPCSPGSYTSSTGQTECTKCAVGTYEPNTGRTSCIAAPIGSYASGVGATSSSKCLPGYYTDTTGRSVCTECQYGYYADGHGSTSCKKCLPGTYQPNKAGNVCMRCPAGHYQDQHGAHNCKQCNTGYNSQTAQATCHACAPGHYNNKMAQSQCLPCWVNSYQDKSGQTTCNACPAGYTQSLTGQTSCNGCDSGQYVSGGRCAPCPVGTYKNYKGAGNCIACKPGTYNTKTGQASCVNCAPGTYQPHSGKTSCVTASVDHYTDWYGATYQISCSSRGGKSTFGQTGRTSVHNCLWDTIQYIGCYKDGSPRALQHLKQISSMTRYKCYIYCRNSGYQIFGLQAGTWCSCYDNTLENRKLGDYGRLAETQCSMPCAGDSSTKCGYGMVNQIFRLIRSDVNYSYLGCYKDGGTRDLRYLFVLASNTVERCYATCKDKGYEFFGMQATHWCLCGNTAGAFGKAYNCNMRCAGNSNQMCGNGWVNSLYVIQNKPYMWLGCYYDTLLIPERTVSIHYGYSKSSGNTINCYKKCRYFGYFFFSLRNRGDCHCGNKFSNSRQSTSLCYKYTCPGNSYEYCGGVGNYALVFMVLVQWG